MQTITQGAAERIQDNPVCLGNLMVLFNRYENTIRRWLKEKDVRLATPSAIAIIKQDTGLTEDKILTQEKKNKVPV